MNQKKCKVAISACLGFLHCRYDGQGFDEFNLIGAKNLLKEKLGVEEIEFYPVCPEQLGGLPTPRPPAEIVCKDVHSEDLKVITKDGQDVTEQFLRGAVETLLFVQKLGIEVVLLKDNSPSCGVKYVYSGKFDGTKKTGKGVTANFLEINGIQVFTVF